MNSVDEEHPLAAAALPHGHDAPVEPYRTVQRPDEAGAHRNGRGEVTLLAARRNVDGVDDVLPERGDGVAERRVSHPGSVHRRADTSPPSNLLISNPRRSLHLLNK